MILFRRRKPNITPSKIHFSFISFDSINLRNVFSRHLLLLGGNNSRNSMNDLLAEVATCIRVLEVHERSTCFLILNPLPRSKKKERRRGSFHCSYENWEKRWGWDKSEVIVVKGWKVGHSSPEDNSLCRSSISTSYTYIWNLNTLGRWPIERVSPTTRGYLKWLESHRCHLCVTQQFFCCSDLLWKKQNRPKQHSLVCLPFLKTRKTGY